MKKIAFITMMLFALVANADNYFTLGDTLRIPPKYLGGYYSTDVRAHIDGFMDNWDIAITYPDMVMPRPWHGIEGGEDLTIAYTDYTGMEQTYNAALTISHDYGEVSSYIPVAGWWDYNMDGILESYGTAKWSAGDYSQMFTFNFFIDDAFRSGYITFDGHIDSGTDRRGAILADVQFYTRTYVYIGYMRGDVSGDGKINITDATILINALQNEGNEIDLDEFQYVAADMNSDGIVNVTDVTILVNILNND